MKEREPDELSAQASAAEAAQLGPHTDAKRDPITDPQAQTGAGVGTAPELASGAERAVSDDELRALHDGRLSRSQARELRRRLAVDRRAQAALGAIIAASPGPSSLPPGPTLEEPAAPPATGTAIGPASESASGRRRSPGNYPGRSRRWAWAVVVAAGVFSTTAVIVVAEASAPVAAPTSPPQRVTYLDRAQLADRYPGIVGQSDAAYFTDLGLGPRQCLITATSMNADELLGTEPVIIEGKFGVLMAYSGTRASSDAPRRREVVTLEVFDRRCEVLAGVTVPR